MHVKAGFLALGLLLFPSTTLPWNGSPNPEPPQWFRQHMNFMMQGNARWITDNAAYRSEDEPFDAYGTEWTWGVGKQSLKGRLFAMRDGKEVETVWEFREVWHPGARKVLVYQFGGDGTYAEGTADSVEANQHRSAQQFFRPDGTKFGVGHLSTETDGGDLLTQSYDISDDGTWTERRYYVWRNREE